MNENRAKVPDIDLSMPTATHNHVAERLAALVVVVMVATMAGCAPEVDDLAVRGQPPVATHGVQETQGTGGGDAALPATATPPLPATATPVEAASPMPDSPDLELPAGAQLVFADPAGVWAVAGGESARLLAPEPLGPPRLEPGLSPDGRWVGYQVDNVDGTVDLRVVPWAGGAAENLVGGAAFTALAPTRETEFPQAVSSVKYAAWLPDSSGVAFTAWETWFPPDAMGWAGYRDDLWVARLDGARVPELLLPPGRGGHFAFSPDMHWVALTRATAGADSSGVVAVARSDGSDERVVFTHPLMSSESDWRVYAMPLWSPDGAWFLATVPIAWAENDPHGWLDGPTQLYRVEPGGGYEELHELGHGSTSWVQNYHAHVSPDAQHVISLESSPSVEPTAGGYPPPAPAPSGDRTVVLQRIGGAEVLAVGRVPRQLHVVAWDPSGRRVALAAHNSEPVRDWSLRVVELDGTSVALDDLVDLDVRGFGSRPLRWAGPSDLIAHLDDGSLVHRRLDGTRRKIAVVHDFDVRPCWPIASDGGPPASHCADE